jgi:Holliday junction resolvase RusA-like endonuclease
MNMSAVVDLVSDDEMEVWDGGDEVLDVWDAAPPVQEEEEDPVPPVQQAPFEDEDEYVPMPPLPLFVYDVEAVGPAEQLNTQDAEEHCYTFTVPGKPSTWSRPAFITNVAGRFMRRAVVNRNKKKTVRFRELVNSYLVELLEPDPVVTPLFPNVAIRIDLEFHRPIPLSEFVGGKRTNPLRRNIEYYATTPDIKRPDIDNMTKFILDALQGIFYKDDCQVVQTVVWKCVDMVPPHEGRTLVTVRQCYVIDMPYAHRYNWDI